jgi:hypothetical protein
MEDVGVRRGSVMTPVETTEIAPTILQLLGLNSDTLQAVRNQGTPILPRQ